VIDSCRESTLYVAQGVHHGFQIDLGSLPLRQRAKVAGLHGAGHVEVIEEVADPFADWA